MKTIRCAFVFTGLLVMVSCISGFSLRTRHVNAVPASEATYSLILYGSESPHKYDTLAVLDIEGDGYRIEPYAPEFHYRVVKGLEPETALKKAEHFVSFHPDFLRTYLSEIDDTEGRAIGYEVRPLYLPINYGHQDLIEVVYILEEGGEAGERIVRLIVRVKPQVEERERLIEIEDD